MSSVVISGDTSGAITVSAPAVAGTTTLTLPATTGTVLNDATCGVCRAWVNFNGTGTPAIRGSFNVTSITDNGTGEFTVNFTTAMSDVNYAVTGICHTPGTTNGALQAPSQSSANQLVGSIRVGAITGALASFFDPSYAYVVIHR